MGFCSAARVEIDENTDGRPERILHYSGGALSRAARDTNGDGNLDTFDRLDAPGRGTLGEGEVDGDGGIAVRRGYYPAHSGREDAFVLALPLPLK